MEKIMTAIEAIKSFNAYTVDKVDPNGDHYCTFYEVDVCDCGAHTSEGGKFQAHFAKEDYERGVKSIMKDHLKFDKRPDWMWWSDEKEGCECMACA
jgi:hypothetical protein